MPGYERVRESFEASIDLSLATTELNVVVMGPARGDDSTASQLRERIIVYAKEYGTAVQPEHRGIVETSKAKWGAGHHLTHLETRLVKISDLVVLIPDSPGSLCELGFFSTVPTCTKKLLILVSNSYPRKGSYVADGPVEAARQGGAQIEYVDYSDSNRCWALVERRIEIVRANKAFEELRSEE